MGCKRRWIDRLRLRNETRPQQEHDALGQHVYKALPKAITWVCMQRVCVSTSAYMQRVCVGAAFPPKWDGCENSILKLLFSCICDGQSADRILEKFCTAQVTQLMVDIICISLNFFNCFPVVFRPKRSCITGNEFR